MPKASNEEEDSDVSVKDEKDMIQKYKSLIAELRDKEESKGGREKREERDCDRLWNFLTLYFVIQFGHF